MVVPNSAPCKRLPPVLKMNRDFDLSLILDALDDEIAVVDTDGTIIAVNAAWCRFAEAGGAPSQSAFVGWNYFDACRAQDEDAGRVGAALSAALSDGKRGRLEYSCPDGDGRDRWFELTIDPVDYDGRRHAIARHTDISTRKVAAARATDAHVTSELLSALVATSNDAIVSYDLDGRIMSWNKAAERLYGYSAAEITGRSMETLYPAGSTNGIGEYRDAIIAGTLTSFEATRVTKSGRQRLMWITAAPIRNAASQIIAVSNIHRDITELRRHEESRQIVAQEVIHRAKNMLTVISAIHRRTAATAKSMEEFNEKFGERIASLSRSTDFLTSENWSTVPLEALIRSQLALFAREDADLSIAGPDVELRPQAVKTIGMALHELGTNATKYGALSDSGGSVAIGWRIMPGDEEPLLRIEWIESGQSFGGAPAHPGFGSTVLTRLAVQLLDAGVDYHFGADGIRWTIDIPAAHFSFATAEIDSGAKD